jgi:hypothetical protein
MTFIMRNHHCVSTMEAQRAIILILVVPIVEMGTDVEINRLSLYGRALLVVFSC